MSQRSLSIDGLTANTSHQKDEVTLFDRRQDKNNSNLVKSNSFDGLSARVSPTQTRTKVQSNKAKQRGWEVVAQARLDAKHQSRIKQRQAAQRAAHHHRQRHNLDNYAQVHSAELELDQQRSNNQRSSQPQVSSWLKIKNLFSSRQLKLSAAGVMAAGLIVSGIILTQQPDVATGSPTGEVQSASTTNTQQTQPAHTPIVDDTSQVETSRNDDGNLRLWTGN